MHTHTHIHTPTRNEKMTMNSIVSLHLVCTTLVAGQWRTSKKNEKKHHDWSSLLRLVVGGVERERDGRRNLVSQYEGACHAFTLETHANSSRALKRESSVHRTFT